MTDKPAWGLDKSFHVDNGELDGLNPAECFVLGYELAQIDYLLKSGESIQRPVHAKNRERIADSCHRAGREFSLSWMKDDRSEMWMWFEVKATKETL